MHFYEDSPSQFPNQPNITQEPNQHYGAPQGLPENSLPGNMGGKSNQRNYFISFANIYFC